MIKKSSKKISLEDILNAINDRFDAIENRFEAMDKRFDGLDKKVDTLVTRVDNLDRSYHYLGVRMEKVEAKFDLALEGYGALKELGEKMNERLNILEGHA